MAEKFEHGETVYLPVTITNTEPGYGYDYKVSFNDFVDNAQCSITVGESQIKTAEEIAEPLKTKADAMTVTADSLQKENEELRANVKDITSQRDKYKEDAEYFHGEKLTAEENARSVRQENATLTGRNKRLESENASLKAELDQRNKDFGAMKKDRDELDSIGGKLRAENDKLKAENDNLRTQVGGYAVDMQDLASDVNFYKTDRDKWLNTAQDNAKLVDVLQEENKSLKQELEGTKAARDGAVDESLERKNRVVTMEEVIVALVEKIRRLEGDET